MTTVDPLQSGGEAGCQVPDGPANHHCIGLDILIYLLLYEYPSPEYSSPDLRLFTVVVEGQEEADTDHGQAQTSSNGSHLAEYLNRTDSSILAQGYLEYLSVNKVNREESGQ